MARAKNIIPSRKLTVMMPENVMERLDAFLWSERSGRVPVGAYQEFFTRRITEYLDQDGLRDLGQSLLQEIDGV